MPDANHPIARAYYRSGSADVRLISPRIVVGPPKELQTCSLPPLLGDEDHVTSSRALPPAASRPSTSKTRRVAPRYHNHRRQPSTAPAARLLRHAQGGQGDSGASACPFGMCQHLQAVVCRRLRPIASGVCGALPYLQRERRSLPLRILQLRPDGQVPHPNHPLPLTLTA